MFKNRQREQNVTMDFVALNPQNSVSDSQLPVSHAVCTDVGRKRSENQDAFGFAQSQHAQLFVVADGMGGTIGGKVASTIATHVVVRACFEHNGQLSEESLRIGVEAANQVVHRLGSENASYQRMGTTIVVLGICHGKVFYAHVGDSRIYHLRNGQITQLTKDHTLVQQLLDTNKIDQAQARRHPISHVLLRSIGGSETTEVSVDVLEQGVEDGDKFVLCCDGLTNEVQDVEIAAVTQALDPRRAVKSLVSLANHRGGSDNVTVQVVEVGELAEGVRKQSSLSTNQLFVSVSNPLEQRFHDVMEPYRRRFDEVSVQELESEIVSLGSEVSVEEIARDTGFGELLDEKTSDKSREQPTKDTAEVEHFGSEVGEETAKQPRSGLPFDTMIFEGESVEDILEIRRLYLAAKAMGTEKLSQVISEAEEPREKSLNQNFSTAVAYLGVFLCGGVAVYLLSPNMNTQRRTMKSSQRIETTTKLPEAKKPMELASAAPTLKTASPTVGEENVADPQLTTPPKDTSLASKKKTTAKEEIESTPDPEENLKNQISPEKTKGQTKNDDESKQAEKRAAAEQQEKQQLEAKARKREAEKKSQAREAAIRKLENELTGLKNQKAELSSQLRQELRKVEKEIESLESEGISKREDLAKTEGSLKRWEHWKNSAERGFTRSVSVEVARESEDIRKLRTEFERLTNQYDEIRRQVSINRNLVSKVEIRKLAQSRNESREALTRAVLSLTRGKVRELQAKLRQLQAWMINSNDRKKALVAKRVSTQRKFDSEVGALNRRIESVRQKLDSPEV